MCDPVLSHVAKESSVVPVILPVSLGKYLFHHGHVKVDGVVQKQRVDRTLYTEDLVDAEQ